jgi:hypothetical protein
MKTRTRTPLAHTISEVVSELNTCSVTGSHIPVKLKKIDECHKYMAI